MLRSITIVVLPDNRGWCFSTEHSDLEIDGAVPVTFYLGRLYYFCVDDVYQQAKDCWGPLYFNPIPKYEPDYSADYCEEMLDWWRSAQC